MSINEDFKREAGQFFTITNPFFVSAFYEWFSLIPDESKKILLEPFAGANNIISLIDELTLFEDGSKCKRKCFDIDTSYENKAPEFEIIKQDTIKNYPIGYDVVITNPPYLAKNSATRRGLSYDYPEYEDLYQKCLEVMLMHTKFVAAIIPESFITSGLFTNRLYSVVSLTCKMFDDTDCPVCLALFVSPEVKENEFKNEINNFYMYRMDKKIGDYYSISESILTLFGEKENIDWVFNDKDGDIGIICIDSTKKPTIEFIRGNGINPDRIKVSSRSLTRVSGLPNGINLDEFLSICNEKLQKYREISNDICLTSFKGLRDDGLYRRRLDFKTAKMIMNSAIFTIKSKQGVL